MSSYLLAVIVENENADIDALLKPYEQPYETEHVFVDKTDEAMRKWMMKAEYAKAPNGKWRELDSFSDEKRPDGRSEQDLVRQYYTVADKSPDELGISFGRYCEQVLWLEPSWEEEGRYGEYEAMEYPDGHFNWVTPLDEEFYVTRGIPKDDLVHVAGKDGREFLLARVRDVADLVYGADEETLAELENEYELFAGAPSMLPFDKLLRDVSVLEEAESKDDIATLAYGVAADAVITSDGAWNKGAAANESMSQWEARFKKRYWDAYSDCLVTFVSASC